MMKSENDNLIPRGDPAAWPDDPANAMRAAAATALLPAWFTERMLSDVWTFGLKLATGEVMVIDTINEVRRASDGSIWLDVSLVEEFEPLNETVRALGDCFIWAPTSRTDASVNAAHVVAAFELADT